MGPVDWLVNIGRTFTDPLPMFRVYLLMLAVASVAFQGCTRATFGFRPSLTSQVPDSTVVRLRATNGQPSVEGRSLGWQTGPLRIVNAVGDTVAVPETGTLEVRLNTKKSYAAIGGIVGFLVGAALAVDKCPHRAACGPDIRPAIGGGIGMLLGWQIRTADWAVVKRPPR